MAESDPKTVLAGLSAAGLGIGWLLNVFRHGRKIGSQQEKLRALCDKVEKVEKTQSDQDRSWQIEKEKIRAEIKAEVKAVHTLIETKHAVLESYFRDSSGNPLILTVTQHEKICGERKKDMDEIKGHIEKIFEAVRGIQTTVAVLGDRQERRE